MDQTNAAKKASSSGQADRLSALPDELLHHVLGFLPAHEVVQTSVLARRWRPLWKSVRRLHITCPVKPTAGIYYDCMRTRDFVNALFLLRGCASLDEVKFEYGLPLKEQTDIWVRHALLCQAQSIIVSVNAICDVNLISLEDPPLVSRHLRKLELNHVSLSDRFLDFASCPTLESLEMLYCDIVTERILSPSVKLLCIDHCKFMNYDRTCISVPSLICLQLNDIKGTAPLLESMPLLEIASVKPRTMMSDYCPIGHWDYCGSCGICCGEDRYNGRSVLLGGLSSAVNLELTTKPGMCLFKRDLRWCPTFSKLKTLLLNDFCVAFDLSALVCILNHSPILENLILHVYKGHVLPSETGTDEEDNNFSEEEEDNTSSEEEEDNTLMEKPAALSRHLKIIKIIFEDYNEKVSNLVRFLTAWGIEVTMKKDCREQVP